MFSYLCFLFSRQHGGEKSVCVCEGQGRNFHNEISGGKSLTKKSYLFAKEMI